MAATLQNVRPVLMVRDVEASLRFYARLGFTETFRDAPACPRYAGTRRDAVEFHLQWHDAGEWREGLDRPTYRLLVREVDELYADLLAAGVIRAGMVVRDMPWGTREFHVQDPDGNGLQFYWPR